MHAWPRCCDLPTVRYYVAAVGYTMVLAVTLLGATILMPGQALQLDSNILLMA